MREQTEQYSIVCVHAQETFIINLDRDSFCPRSILSLPFSTLPPFRSLDSRSIFLGRIFLEKEKILSFSLVYIYIYIDLDNGRRKMIGIGRLGDKCPWRLGISSSR